MKIKVNKVLSMILVIAAMYSQAALSNYPATFKTEKESISTINQFLVRIKDKHSEFAHEVNKQNSTIYKEKSYPSLVIQSQGIHKGTKYFQKLTYIETHKDLWKLVYIEGEKCVKGQVFRDGEQVTKWGCKENFLPVSSAFFDKYLIDHEKVDLDTLSKSWGKSVSLNNYSAIKISANQEKRILSLGDMKTLMENKGAQWSVVKTTGTHYTNKKFPALKVTVLGAFDDRDPQLKLHHSFLYASEDGFLRLKEIEGKNCRYVVRLQKEICEDIFRPTSVTPFPMVLSNSMELTHSSKNNQVRASESQNIRFNCGNVGEIFVLALRIHFEKSAFMANDTELALDALYRLPESLDSTGILFDDSEKFDHSELVKSLFPSDKSLVELLNNIHANDVNSRNCNKLIPLVDGLNRSLLDKRNDMSQLFKLMVSENYSESEIQRKITEFTPWQKSIWGFMRARIDKELSSVFPEIALDVAAGDLQNYFYSVLNRMSDREEVITSAFVKLDAYSSLLDEPLIVGIDAMLGGKIRKRYFGLSIYSGYNGHYIRSAHKETQDRFGIRIGDRLLSINGIDASYITAEEIDSILIQTGKEIDLVLERDSRVVHTQVRSSELDIFKLAYAMDVLQSSDDKNYLKIKIDSFNTGLADSIHQDIKVFTRTNQVDGYVLDLQSNPGGNVDEALAIASFFAKETILSFYRTGHRTLKTAKPLWSDSKYFISETAPVVVIINSDTKSSAEILSSTLKSINRAVIVGSQSFGKHVAQSYVPVSLSNKRNLGMLVTSTEYFDPQGLSINGVGVEPDVTLFSANSHSFEDGNSKGVNYAVPIDLQRKPYTDFISSGNLDLIKSTVEIDQGSLESVVMAILKKSMVL